MVISDHFEMGSAQLTASRASAGTGHRSTADLRSREAGYPRIVFAYHDGATVSPTRVRTILTREVGLTEMEALRLVRGRRR